MIILELEEVIETLALESSEIYNKYAGRYNVFVDHLSIVCRYYTSNFES